MPTVSLSCCMRRCCFCKVTFRLGLHFTHRKVAAADQKGMMPRPSCIILFSLEQRRRINIIPQCDMIMHFSIVSAINLDNHKLSLVRTVFYFQSALLFTLPSWSRVLYLSSWVDRGDKDVGTTCKKCVFAQMSAAVSFYCWCSVFTPQP